MRAAAYFRVEGFSADDDLLVNSVTTHVALRQDIDSILSQTGLACESQRVIRWEGRDAELSAQQKFRLRLTSAAWNDGRLHFCPRCRRAVIEERLLGHFGGRHGWVRRLQI
jgi:hypothetical protein